jgi:hypothetical protein
VEHPCYKCGAAVEDGIAFCPQCSAPQIRVGGTQLTEPAGPTEIAGQQPRFADSVGASIEWSKALRSAGIALAAAIFMMLLGMPPALGMLAAGFLSVLLYRRLSIAGHVTTGMGARLGAFSGALGFGVLALVLAIVGAFGSGQEIHNRLLQVVQQYAARNTDPQTQQVLELFKTPEGFAVIMVLSLVMTLVGFLVCSSLGGAMGAFLLRRRDRL